MPDEDTIDDGNVCQAGAFVVGLSRSRQVHRAFSELQGIQDPLETLLDFSGDRIQRRIIRHPDQLPRINGTDDDIASIGLVHDDVARKQHTDSSSSASPRWANFGLHAPRMR